MGIYAILNGHKIIFNFDLFLKNEGPKWAYIIEYIYAHSPL